MRRLLLVLIATLILYATLRVFGESRVDATSEYLGLLGLLSVATTFYMKWRKDEDHDSTP